MRYRLRWAWFHLSEFRYAPGDLAAWVVARLPREFVDGFRVAFVPPVIVTNPVSIQFRTPNRRAWVLQWIWHYCMGVMGQGMILWIHDRGRGLTLEIRNADRIPPEVRAKLRAATTWVSESPKSA